MTVPFSYDGDAAMRAAIGEALRRVIDPEMALDIVNLGLVYGVEAQPGRIRLRITMTSAACPVSEFIVDEIGYELKQTFGKGTDVLVQIVWEPPWTPERMSERARAAMDW